MRDRRLIGLVFLYCIVGSLPARAEGMPPAPPSPSTTLAPANEGTVAKKGPEKRTKWMVHVNGAFNVYTYLGPTSSAGSGYLTPDKRASMGEQVGVGYFFHPNLSARLTLQFGETLTGLPAGASPFTLFGAIPWLVYSLGGFYIGAGPMVDFITYGKTNMDFGVYAATGYGFALGKGFSLGIGVNTITMFLQRTFVAINPVVSLAYRF